VTSGRFRDDGRRIEDFADHVIVVCPRCGEHADVRPFDPGDGVRRNAAASVTPRRLVCGNCALTRTHLQASAGFGRATDPYFDLPLALKAPCAGHVIWAYNTAHLDHLLAYVEATIRSRPIPATPEEKMPASLLERMPGWFGAASNRAAISRALRGLGARSDNAETG
jgi:hypothetical protein